MQVSWIDENNLRDLAGQLTNSSPESKDDEGSQRAKGLAWELHTLPDSAFEASPTEAWQSIAVENPEVAKSEPPVSRDTNHSTTEENAPPPMPSAAIDQIRESLRSVREKAAEAGLLKSIQLEPSELPVVASEPEASPPTDSRPPPPSTSEIEASRPSEEPTEFNVPFGPVPVRLEAFAAWARSILGDAELFLLDEEGHLLWGVQAKSGLVLSAMLAWSAARHSSAAGASTMLDVLHQSLPNGGEICVVPCETQHGMIQIGIHRSEPLPRERARLLRGALRAAMSVGETV